MVSGASEYILFRSSRAHTHTRSLARTHSSDTFSNRIKYDRRVNPIAIYSLRSFTKLWTHTHTHCMATADGWWWWRWWWRRQQLVSFHSVCLFVNNIFPESPFVFIYWRQLKSKKFNCAHARRPSKPTEQKQYSKWKVEKNNLFAPPLSPHHDHINGNDNGGGSMRWWKFNVFVDDTRRRQFVAIKIK